MSAIQEEVLHVKDPQAEATRLVNAIPINQGLYVESPLGEQLGLWREAEDTFELTFRHNVMKGSATLAIRAVARFMDFEARRKAALDLVQETVGKALGLTLASPAHAVNDNTLKN